MSKRENYDAKVQEIQKNQKKLKEMLKLSAKQQLQQQKMDSGGVMEGARDSMNLVGEYMCQMESAKGGLKGKYVEADEEDLPHPGTSRIYWTQCIDVTDAVLCAYT